MTTTELVDKLVLEWKRSPKVLLVDDDYDFSVLLSHSLEKFGADIDIVTTVSGAKDKIEFQSIKNIDYDIIFLDLKIPPENGPEVMKYAKMKMPKTPIVIVTGYPDSDLVSEALRFGYIGLISKPINFNELETLFMKHKIPTQV